MQRLSRRGLLKAGIGALLGVTGAAALAGRGPLRHRILSYRVPWNIDRALLVAQLTDLHVGLSTPIRGLEAAIETVRGAQPDLVVLTGDYLNHGLHHLDALKTLLKRLPRPAVATLGNHDHWSGATEIQEMLSSLDIEVLRNEVTHRRLSGMNIEIIGVDDGRTRKDDVERACKTAHQPDEALILSHFPPTADRITKEGGRMILSGHTHGGQVYLPGITPWVAERSGSPYLAGWYELDARARVYVSAGLGHSRSGLRVGEPAHPEVTFFRLEPESKR